MYKGEVSHYCYWIVFHYELHRAVFEKRVGRSANKANPCIIWNLNVQYHVDKKSLLDLTWDRWSQGTLYLWSIFVLLSYLHLNTNYVLKWDATGKLRVELQLYAFLTWSLRMVWLDSPSSWFISQYIRDRKMGRSASASRVFFSKSNPNWWIQSLSVLFITVYWGDTYPSRRVQYFVVFICIV